MVQPFKRGLNRKKNCGVKYEKENGTVKSKKGCQIAKGKKSCRQKKGVSNSKNKIKKTYVFFFATKLRLLCENFSKLQAAVHDRCVAAGARHRHSCRCVAAGGRRGYVRVRTAGVAAACACGVREGRGWVRRVAGGTRLVQGGSRLGSLLDGRLF